MKNIYLFIIIYSCFVFKLVSQPIFPENGELYVDNIVPRIDISIDPDTLNWLYQEENLESDIEYHAVFIFNNGVVVDTIDPVGFRLRGNTSRHSQKKSFKVSFNTFTKGGKYYGVEKLNLNGEHNDPSVIRSKIGWDLMRQFEIPAPRANHVEVYINGDYYGLYISVEHIDEEFVKSRFTYNDGNLYKCLWPANLNYLGEDPELYKITAGDRRVYELKINKEADDYSDLANFIGIINNTPDEELVCELEKVFNVYDYMKVITIDILTGNWDGYIYNQNNFYLYHNTTSGKFEFIPYDLDNTLGIDWMNRDWGTRNIYDWQQHGDNYRPLYERLMNLAEFRDQYTYYSTQLVESIDFDSLKNAISARRDMIYPFITDDPYYPQDYGYSTEDFLNSFTQAIGGHVKYGIFPYFETRLSATGSQVENTEMDPVIKYIRHSRKSPTEIWVNVFIESGANTENVDIYYYLEGIGSTFEPMFDDGQHNDGEAGDLNFGGTIKNIPENTDLEYQIEVYNGNGKTSLLPCEPVLIPATGAENPALFINEFMASNESTISDEQGDYDDWIEIYNAESEPVWLGDKFLTDNLTKPDKWAMPDAYIQAGEFLLIWADDDPEQGQFHTNFKLSKSGEEIGLFDSHEMAIDDYVFGEQETDISEGRLPDGDDNWVFFTSPTPRVSNQQTSVDENLSNHFYLFPNPSTGGKVSLSITTNFKVYNSLGLLIDEVQNSQFFNTSQYNKGLYIVVIDSGQKLKLIVH